MLHSKLNFINPLSIIIYNYYCYWRISLHKTNVCVWYTTTQVRNIEERKRDMH